MSFRKMAGRAYIYILAFVINRSPRQTRGDGERGRLSFSFSAGANTRERVALLSSLRAVRKPPRVFCLGKGQPNFQCVLCIDIPGAKFCRRDIQRDKISVTDEFGPFYVTLGSEAIDDSVAESLAPLGPRFIQHLVIALGFIDGKRH